MVLINVSNDDSHSSSMAAQSKDPRLCASDDQGSAKSNSALLLHENSPLLVIIRLQVQCCYCCLSIAIISSFIYMQRARAESCALDTASCSNWENPNGRTDIAAAPTQQVQEQEEEEEGEKELA